MTELIQSCAYVIHQRPYKNTSALVDLLTQEHGLIRAVVNGLQGKNKKQLHWKGLLQAFKPLTITWKGDGGLKTLNDVEAQTIEVHRSLKGQYLYCGFYVNEVLQKILSGEDVDSSLFEIYQKCISNLLLEKDMQTSLRLFESQLLQALGYGVDLYTDTQGHKISRDLSYIFNAHDGFCVSQIDKPLAISGEQLQLIAMGDFSQKQTKSIAKYIFREALQVHINVDKLQSRRLFVNI